MTRAGVPSCTSTARPRAGSSRPSPTRRAPTSGFGSSRSTDPGTESRHRSHSGWSRSRTPRRPSPTTWVSAGSRPWASPAAVPSRSPPRPSSATESPAPAWPRERCPSRWCPAPVTCSTRTTPQRWPCSPTGTPRRPGSRGGSSRSEACWPVRRRRSRQGSGRAPSRTTSESSTARAARRAPSRSPCRRRWRTARRAPAGTTWPGSVPGTSTSTPCAGRCTSGTAAPTCACRRGPVLAGRPPARRHLAPAPGRRAPRRHRAPRRGPGDAARRVGTGKPREPAYPVRLGSMTMETAEIARRWLAFFEEKGHAVVPSAPLPYDDPNLLFVVAGMVPFVPYFSGQQTAAVAARRLRPEVRAHPRPRRGGQDQPARHVLPDERQLLVRRLLQARRHRVCVGAAHRAGRGRPLRPRPGEAVGQRLRGRRRGRGALARADRHPQGADRPARPARQLLAHGHSRPGRTLQRDLRRPRPRVRTRRRPDGRRGPLLGDLEPRLHRVRARRGAEQGRLRHRRTAAEEERRHGHGPGADRQRPAGRRQPLRDRPGPAGARPGGRDDR